VRCLSRCVDVSPTGPWVAALLALNVLWLPLVVAALASGTSSPAHCVSLQHHAPTPIGLARGGMRKSRHVASAVRPGNRLAAARRDSDLLAHPRGDLLVACGSRIPTLMLRFTASGVQCLHNPAGPKHYA